MGERCFCHFSGFRVKDSQARKDVAMLIEKTDGIIEKTDGIIEKTDGIIESVETLEKKATEVINLLFTEIGSIKRSITDITQRIEAIETGVPVEPDGPIVPEECKHENLEYKLIGHSSETGDGIHNIICADCGEMVGTGSCEYPDGEYVCKDCGGIRNAVITLDGVNYTKSCDVTWGEWLPTKSEVFSALDGIYKYSNKKYYQLINTTTGDPVLKTDHLTNGNYAFSLEVTLYWVDYYDFDGVIQSAYHYPAGADVTVKHGNDFETIVSSGKEFNYWTDANGDVYAPGDTFIINKKGWKFYPQVIADPVECDHQWRLDTAELDDYTTIYNYKCALCGETKTETHPCDHVYSAWVENPDSHTHTRSCALCDGLETEECEHDHYEMTEATHTSHCKCGRRLSDTEEHNFVNHVCTVCGYEEKCEHQWRLQTAELDGYTTIYTYECAVCGETKTEIHACDHVYSAWMQNPDGQSHTRTCSVCGGVETETCNIHDYGYTADGHTAYCKCGRRMSDYQKPHNYVNGVCSVCGYECNHQWQLQSAIIDGYNTRYVWWCAVCGETKVETHACDHVINNGKCDICGGVVQ